MVEQRYHLARIEVANFKRFPHLEVELSRFDLLVGPNNSGKTSVLEACRLFDFCYRTCLRGQNGNLHLVDEVAVTAGQLPIPGELMHHHDVRDADEGDAPYWPPPVVVGATLRLRDETRRYAFRLDLQGGNQFVLRREAGCDPPVPADRFGVVFVPGFVGLLAEEERRTAAVLRGKRSEGAYGEILRNLLFDLKRDADKWDLLLDLLSEVFSDLELLPVEFDEQVNRYLFAPYDERQPGHAQPVRLDLFAAGSGLHQFVQVFTALLTENAPTILLDEPDAHMFSRLQGQLYRALQRMKEKGFQIIAATHAPSLIAAADPRQIVNFAADPPRRLGDAYEVDEAARELGAFDNLMLLLVQAHGRLIFVEGKDKDEKVLRSILAALLSPADWRRIQGRLVFLRNDGRPTPQQIDKVLNAFERVFGTSVRAFVVVDRDYRSDADLEKEQDSLKAHPRQTWHVWRRVEIENYLLDEKVAVRLIIDRARATGRPLPDEGQLHLAFWAAVDASCEAARQGFSKRVAAEDRERREQTRKPPREAYEIVTEAERRLKELWKGEQKLWYCDAKGVLKWLRREGIEEDELISAVAQAGAPDDLRAVATNLRQFLIG